MKKITPFIWFKEGAEAAAKFYVSIFSRFSPNSKITETTRYDAEMAKASGQPEGTVMTVTLELGGEEFIFINGGAVPPESGFNIQLSNAISFVINCETQEEVDYYWEKLSEGGKTDVCGWIRSDKYGITWQVTPEILLKLMADPDPEKAKRVAAAMLKMTKIDIAALEKAAKG